MARRLGTVQELRLSQGIRYRTRPPLRLHRRGPNRCRCAGPSVPFRLGPNRISSRTRVVNCSDARLTSSPTDASRAGESWVATPDKSSSILPAPRSSIAAALQGDQCRWERVEIRQTATTTALKAIKIHRRTATDVCSRRREGGGRPAASCLFDHHAASRCDQTLPHPSGALLGGGIEHRYMELSYPFRQWK